MKPNAIEQEFIKTYDQFADAIFRHCVFRVSDREKAKDLAQGTFVRLWDYMSQGKEIENTRAFLYRIANNLIIDEYRKRKDDSLDRMRDDEGFDIGFEPRHDIETKDDYARAQSLLDRLPDKYREAIVMRHVDGLSVKDIAHLTHETENVISVRIHRAIEKLKVLAEKQDHGKHN
jgi:RNA polymerase sigma-70 factor (ECF subfamily)